MPLLPGSRLQETSVEEDFQMSERLEIRAAGDQPGEIRVEMRVQAPDGNWDPGVKRKRFLLRDRVRPIDANPGDVVDNRRVAETTTFPAHTLASSTRALGLLMVIPAQPLTRWDKLTATKWQAAKDELEQALGRSISGMTEDELGLLVIQAGLKVGWVLASEEW